MLLVALIIVCCVLAIVLGVLKLRGAPRNRATGGTTEAEPIAAVRRGGLAGRAARRRRQPVQSAADNDDDDEDMEDDAEVTREVAGTSRTARLAARKAAKRAQKEEQRAAREEEADGEQPVARSAYEESRRQKEREREETEALQDEEIRRAQEERLQREAEEYSVWHGAITVEGQGEAAVSQAQEEATRNALAEFIRRRKVVWFEELSAEFKMPTKDVVHRIKELEAACALSGIMDDRGKVLLPQYIYLSAQELAAVAEHIRNRGRISISDLSSTASKLLDLESKDVDGVQGSDLSLGDDIEE